MWLFKIYRLDKVKEFTLFSPLSCVLCLVAEWFPTLCDPMDCSLPGYSVHGDSPGKNTGVLPCPSPGIFPSQGLNPSLPHCRQILYHLSHQGSPASQEWVACPFFRGTSWPRNWTGVSCIASGFFTSWASREALLGRMVVLFLVFWETSTLLPQWLLQSALPPSAVQQCFFHILALTFSFKYFLLFYVFTLTLVV